MTAPQTPDAERLRKRLRALADEWNAVTAELPRMSRELPAKVDAATRSRINARARQLNECATDLRAALEET